jgi:hypothetical protein
MIDLTLAPEPPEAEMRGFYDKAAAQSIPEAQQPELNDNILSMTGRLTV